jgi:hypothetical protein
MLYCFSQEMYTEGRALLETKMYPTLQGGGKYPFIGKDATVFPPSAGWDQRILYAIFNGDPGVHDLATFKVYFEKHGLMRLDLQYALQSVKDIDHFTNADSCAVVQGFAEISEVRAPCINACL